MKQTFNRARDGQHWSAESESGQTNSSFHQNVAQFWNVVRQFEKPEWQSSNRVVLHERAFRLRQFTEGRSGTPIVILGPQAGHHTSIVDFGLPHQSLVALCANHTDRPIYAVEWKAATVDRRNETLDDLVLQTDRIVQSVGGRAHLVGLCQAGWLSTIYASLFPSKVVSLVLGGAPIDFTAGGGKIQLMVQTLPFSYYSMLVAMGSGVMRGRYILWGFKSFNPYERFVGDYLKLFNGINNPVVVERSRRFRRWYEYTQGIAGAWYKQAVYELFKRNKLVQGRLKVLRRNVDLKSIACPVALIAGQQDDITLEPQLFNMQKYVSGPVSTASVPQCGHIGLFIKRNALEEYWRPALDFVLNHTRVMGVA